MITTYEQIKEEYEQTHRCIFGEEPLNLENRIFFLSEEYMYKKNRKISSSEEYGRTNWALITYSHTNNWFEIVMKVGLPKKKVIPALIHEVTHKRHFDEIHLGNTVISNLYWKIRRFFVNPIMDEKRLSDQHYKNFVSELVANTVMAYTQKFDAKTLTGEEALDLCSKYSKKNYSGTVKSYDGFSEEQRDDMYALANYLAENNDSKKLWQTLKKVRTIKQVRRLTCN